MEALGLGILGCGLGSSQRVIAKADGIIAADLDGEECSFEFTGASRDENNICALGRQLSGSAEAHAFGCTGDEDCLQALLVVLCGREGLIMRRIMMGHTLPSTGNLLPPKKPMMNQPTRRVTTEIVM